MVTLAGFTDLVALGSPRSAHLRAARARRLHAEAAAQASAELALMRAGHDERFAVACAAPFRERTGLELAAAARDGRRAPLLQVFALPGPVGRWRTGLDRDFGVTDAAGAAFFVGRRSALALDQASDCPAGATLLAAQAVHVATAAAGVGYWPGDEALDAVAGPIRLIRSLHASWQGYGAAFLAGERTCGHPDDVRHIVFSQVVERLLTDERSPWRCVDW